MDPSIERVKNLIRLCQGFKREPYRDGGGWAWGYGFNLTSLSQQVVRRFAEACLDIWVCELLKEVRRLGGWVDELPETPKAVLMFLVHAVGAQRLQGYEEFLSALQRKEWSRAADELKRSRYAVQAPRCVSVLVELLKRIEGSNVFEGG